jgi:hypothetical protein
MKRLGNTNLFTSDFVMGSRESQLKFTKTQTIEIDVLHKWMDFKDSDWGMKKYRTKRTQYISFPHLIDLQNLSLIIQDLMRIYKLQYPYAKKEDFIETVFEYSIFDIKNFIEREYTWYGGCPNIKEFDFYYTYQRIGSEFIDFILDADKDIDYYKQYFKKVLQLIEEIEYNPIAIVASDDEHKETETKTVKLTAPVLGWFCYLINKIEIDRREETESAKVYCERICIKYKLPYSDRVRQNYNVNRTTKLLKELTEKVFPLIDDVTKKIIQKDLISK